MSGTMKKTSIYLDEELDRALAAKAAEEGVSKAEFIRRNLEVVARRTRRPRLSVGKAVAPPGFVPGSEGPYAIHAEYADLLDREHREIRESYRREHGER